MSDNIKVQNNTVKQLDSSLTSYPKEQASAPNEIGKDQFLQLLVAQLKNQDPMNPMENEDFAVDLAQFSQLEQLISINNNLGAGGSGESVGSLAAYLGHEVILNRDTVNVRQGSAEPVGFELDFAAQNVKLELLDADGNVRAASDLGELEAGYHSSPLSNMSVEDGEYTVRLTALTESGSSVSLESILGGVVSGFVPGPEPVLLVNGREVQPAEIKEVRMVQG